MGLKKLNNKNIAFTLVILFGLLFSFGCNFGPLEPGRKAIFNERENWLELTKSRLVSDEVFYTTNKGDISPVLINALPLSETILVRGKSLWPEDKHYKATLEKWFAKGQLVVLVGLYANNLKNDDLLKDERFRFYLEQAGQKIASSNIQIANKKFLADYFPVFNHWEIVLAVSFQASWGAEPRLNVQWPTGTRQLDLSKAVFGPPGDTN
jgi:hypothetical protein